jgi:hypothetical protein
LIKLEYVSKPWGKKPMKRKGTPFSRVNAGYFCCLPEWEQDRKPQLQGSN